MPAVHHLVMLKFKADVVPQEIDEMFARLNELKQTIPGVTYFAGGEDTSPEGMAHGHTHAFLMTFENEAARDAYLPHPEHEQFKSEFVPLVDTVTIVDFSA